MDICDMATPLLSDIEKINIDQYGSDALPHVYDSSSGYDSDSEPDVPMHRSRDIPEVTSRSQNPKVIRYKSTQHLCEDLRLILDMPEMCDVTFHVGPSKIPVNGVRAILATRSRVFYNLLLKHMQEHRAEERKQKKTKPAMFERLTIPVRKYDSEVFRSIVQFIHCGTVTLTEDSVAGILCGADQFELPELEAACWKFIDRCLSSGRGEVLLFPTRCYRHSRKCEAILNRIYSVLDKEMMDNDCSRGRKEEVMDNDCSRGRKEEVMDNDCSRGRKEEVMDNTCSRGRKEDVMDNTCSRGHKEDVMDNTCSRGRKEDVMDNDCSRGRKESSV